MTYRRDVADRTRVLLAPLLMLLIAAGPVGAQQRASDRPSLPASGGILQSLPRVASQSGLLTKASSASQQRAPSRTRSKRRIVFGAMAGAAGGFFAGGFLGAAIEGDRCNCDDPGFLGFLIGAPVGAVAGGIAGGFWLF